MFSYIKNKGVDFFYYWGLRSLVKAGHRKKMKEYGPLIRKVKSENVVWNLESELCQLIDCVKQVKNVEGDMAEVGVFEGATAKLISSFKGDKALHLFDTFEGLPDQIESCEKKLFSEGQFASRRSLEQMKKEFEAYSNVHFYKGIFPADTGHLVEDRTFSFVHLDVDLYSSTLDSLKFFYPRMAVGGIILSHDHLIAEGVRKAFAEYFGEMPVPVIPVAGSQCMVVKCN